ncbi:probable aquaporin NIP-type [Henckelia pumila]|uniref:probable aquaporin NIP-type n=1 Tax=Henckelia pumila TaxID=405737 RepID=UPI003C6E2B9D
MASKSEGIEEEQISKMESGMTTTTTTTTNSSDENVGFWSSLAVVTTAQKVLAELLGTYFLIFAGCGSVVVNKLYGEKITHPGISVTWGVTVMALIYTVGHVSGAHFNPAVSISLATFRRFPWKEVPLYIISQLLGSILASWTLSVMFSITSEAYFGTLPVGSNGQSLAIEIVISSLLMFVVSAVATDNRANAGMGGIAVGMTIMLNVFVAGPISGASMNPARSIGPALVRNTYKGLWVYIIGPIIGTLAGAFAYNLIRSTNKPLRELAKSGSLCSKR